MGAPATAWAAREQEACASAVAADAPAGAQLLPSGTGRNRDLINIISLVATTGLNNCNNEPDKPIKLAVDRGR